MSKFARKSMVEPGSSEKWRDVVVAIASPDGSTPPRVSRVGALHRLAGFWSVVLVLPLIAGLDGCRENSTVALNGDGGSGDADAGSGSGEGGNSHASGGLGGGTVGTGGAAGTGSPRCPASDMPETNDPSGNLWRCGGLAHRVGNNACPPVSPRTTQLPATSLGDECRRDTDCVTKPYGQCISASGFGGANGNSCRYGCASETDCAPGEVCDCVEGFVGSCVAARCTTDAACAPGKLCVAAVTADCSGLIYACQSAADTCAVNADCISGQCRWSGDHFACFVPGCPVP